MTKEERMDIFARLINLSENQINAICDSGVFNEIIQGYIVTAIKQIGIKKEQINDIDFYNLFDRFNAYEARQQSKEYGNDENT